MPDLDPDAARDHVRSEHGDVIAAVRECADAVADSWRGERPTDANRVVDPVEACLRDTGVLATLPDILASAVAAAGGELPAEPVAAPPYVVVTSRGPVLRATLDDGRLIVRFEVFRVTDDGRYERASGDLTVVVEVR